MYAEMSFTEVFIVGMMILIVVMYIRQYYGEVDLVKASDGRRYVVRKLPDSAKAAELLAQLNQRLQKLVRHMVARFPGDADVDRLHANFNPDALSEGGAEVGYTSYSVNKGEKIVMCLRQSDNAFVDVNILTYVAIHELGHLMTEEIGHTPGFWKHFKRLALEAKEVGVYTPVNFAEKPESYCGITIGSSVI